MKAWLRHHADTLRRVFTDLLRNPFASIMSISVIAIALALPGGLYAALQNISTINVDFEHGAKVSLFLREDIDIEAAGMLRDSLQDHPRIRHIELISPEQAMAEFKRNSGLREALETLPRNPLPVVLVVHPQAQAARNRDELDELIAELGSLEPVEVSQFDLDWIRRLSAIVELAQRTVWVLAGILGLGVFLIVGNTIRLAIANRHEEIGIVKLIGGTDAFIRRPFLYYGLLQGLGGAFAALLIIELLFIYLAEPVTLLSRAYQGGIHLQGLGSGAAMLLVTGGGLLGWAAARLTVGVYLHRIDPGKSAG